MTLARGKVVIFGLALAVAVLAPGTPARAGVGDPVRFSPDQVSLESEQELLKLRFFAGRTHTIRTYSLTGDGRLSIFTQRNASATPELLSSGPLSDAELSALVETLMQSRL